MLRASKSIFGVLQSFSRLIITILFFVLIILYHYAYFTVPDADYCFQHYDSRASDLEDILLADYKPTLGRSIFFHETTCHIDLQWTHKISRNPVKVDYKPFGISTRQACAIESAAFHNPNRDVFVLFTSNIAQDDVTARPILHALLSYTNLYLRKANLFTYTENTPVSEWTKRGDIFKSKYITAHISDLMRLVSLYRYGGIYFDLDCILLKSFQDIPLNFIGAQSTTLLANGVMSFAPTGIGHNITEKCLIKFKNQFNGQEWGLNGPQLVTSVLGELCNVKTLIQSGCHGVKAFDKNAFYEVYYKEWQKFFNPVDRDEVLRRIKSSYLVHLWNKFSHELAYKIGSEAAFEKLVRENCPKVFEAAVSYGYTI